MSRLIYSPLMVSLGRHFCLSKSRLATIAVVIVGLVNGRTVNLTHLASQFPGDAKQSSNYRRLQRFFQHVHLDQAQIAYLVVQLLNLSRPKCLVLDRTNWKLGATDINFLVLAIVTRRFRVPILWTLLPHQGNSSTQQRIALMKRYLAIFEASSIECLLADREFIGPRWMSFLNENNIPFVIRVKVAMRITLSEGGTWSFKTLVRGHRLRTVCRCWSGIFPGSNDMLQFAAREIKGRDWLIIATNMPDAKRALQIYRKRWGIENLFADSKTRGFNLEDTHITNPEKLSTLFGLVTLAITWAYRCATQTMGLKAIKRKTHKRRQKSWFRIGFDILRYWILHQPHNAINAWIHKCPIRALSS